MIILKFYKDVKNKSFCHSCSKSKNPLLLVIHARFSLVSSKFLTRFLNCKTKGYIQRTQIKDGFEVNRLRHKSTAHRVSSIVYSSCMQLLELSNVVNTRSNKTERLGQDLTLDWYHKFQSITDILCTMSFI